MNSTTHLFKNDPLERRISSQLRERKRAPPPKDDESETDDESDRFFRGTCAGNNSEMRAWQNEIIEARLIRWRDEQRTCSIPPSKT